MTTPKTLSDRVSEAVTRAAWAQSEGDERRRHTAYQSAIADLTSLAREAVAEVERLRERVRRLTESHGGDARHRCPVAYFNRNGPWRCIFSTGHSGAHFYESAPETAYGYDYADRATRKDTTPMSDDEGKTSERTPWQELSRKPIGVHVSTSSGPGTYTYACTVYEVMERRSDEWRTRIEHGPAVYAHESPHVMWPVLLAAYDWITRLLATRSGARKDAAPR